MGLALLLDISSGGYQQARDAVLDSLKAWRVESQVRAGAVIPVSSEMRSVTFSSFRAGRGRQLEEYARGRSAAAERYVTKELLASARLVRASEQSPPDLLGGSRLECLSVSNVTPSEQLELARLPAVDTCLVRAIEFDDVNALHRRLLWDQLLLVGMTSTGRRYDHYEDLPDDLDRLESVGWFVPSSTHIRSTNSDGFFWEAGPIFFDAANADVVAVPDLPDLSQVHRVRDDPVTSAMRSAIHVPTTRSSSQDDLAAQARFVPEDFQSRFADPMGDETKVRTYCLNPAHPLQKWKGFAAHGYDATDPQHPYLLAALLAGALQEPFVPTDARATADGSLQFGVDVALPRIEGGYTSCATAWVVGAGGRPRLSTAFVTGSSSRSLARPPLMPTSAFDSEAALFECVEASALGYAKEYVGDSLRTWGFLWVRHDDERSRSFARWLHRNRKDSVGEVLRRHAWGGRVTQFVVSDLGVLQTDAWLARAQVLLLLAGVRVHTQLHVD